MQKVFSAKKMLALTGIVGSLFCGPATNAATITIGLAEDNATIGAIVNQNVSSLGGVTFGDFTVGVSSTSNIPLGELLIGNTIDIEKKGVGTHTLYVYITASGITGAVQPFISVFQENTLKAGNSVVETTFLSLTNQLWTGTLIGGPATFTGPGSFTNIIDTSALSTSGTYSVTELFAITASTGGSSNSTTNIYGTFRGEETSTTPLPAALPLFTSVLGGGLLFGRLRSRRKARAQLDAI